MPVGVFAGLLMPHQGSLCAGFLRIMKDPLSVVLLITFSTLSISGGWRGGRLLPGKCGCCPLWRLLLVRLYGLARPLRVEDCQLSAVAQSRLFGLLLPPSLLVPLLPVVVLWRSAVARLVLSARP